MQVCQLKDRARVIAGLSETEYTELVHQARDFSLALSSWVEDLANPPSQALRSVARSAPTCPRVPPACCLPPVTVAGRSEEQAMEEEGGGAHPRPDLHSLSRTSRHFSPLKADGDAEDEDSGVYSKTASCSMASEDSEWLGEDSDRVGVLHYFNDCSLPPKKRTTLTAKASTRAEIKQQHDLAYDGAFEADSDQERDAVKPSSGGRIIKATNKYDKDLEGSQGTEMTTFKYQEGASGDEDEEFALEYTNAITRHTNSMQYDEAVSCDSDDSSTLQSVRVDKQYSSDDNLDNVIVHKRLYSQDSCGFTKMEDPLSDDDCEDLPLFDPTARRSHGGPMQLSRPTAASVSTRHQQENEFIFHSAPNYGATRNATRNYGTVASRGDVDSKVAFFPQKQPSSSTYQPAVSSSGSARAPQESNSVRIEKTMKARSSPPFGYPLQMSKLNNSTGKLYGSRAGKDPVVPNLPKADPISADTHRDRDTGSSSDTDKKKKKKKKKSHSKYCISAHLLYELSDFMCVLFL